MRRAHSAVQVVLGREHGQALGLRGRAARGLVERGAESSAEHLADQDHRLAADGLAPAAGTAEEPAFAGVEGDQLTLRAAAGALVDRRAHPLEHEELPEERTEQRR